MLYFRPNEVIEMFYAELPSRDSEEPIGFLLKPLSGHVRTVVETRKVGSEERAIIL